MANSRKRPPGSEAKMAIDRERQDKALRLRMAGATWDEVAKGAGYAHSTGALRAVQTALDRIPKQAAEQYLTLELARLDTLNRAWWPAALQRDEKAAAIVLRISERRSKLLGLDDAERRIADAAQATAIIEAEKLQLLSHALFTAMSRTDLTADQQHALATALNDTLVEVGLTPPLKEITP